MCEAFCLCVRVRVRVRVRVCVWVDVCESVVKVSGDLLGMEQSHKTVSVQRQTSPSARHEHI